MTAQAQNACSSSRFKRRCPPPLGSSTYTLSGSALGRTERVKLSPATLNVDPGSTVRAAPSCAAASFLQRFVTSTSTGRIGSRSRVRSSMRALRRRRYFLRESSCRPIGHGATHRPQRSGSLSAHSARSRYKARTLAITSIAASRSAATVTLSPVDVFRVTVLVERRCFQAVATSTGRRREQMP